MNTRTESGTGEGGSSGSQLQVTQLQVTVYHFALVNAGTEAASLFMCTVKSRKITLLACCSRLTFLYSLEKWWLFHPQLIRKSLTDIPTGQPVLANSTLNLSSQIFLDWIKLAVNSNQHTGRYHFNIQFPDIPEDLTKAVI